MAKKKQDAEKAEEKVSSEELPENETAAPAGEDNADTVSEEAELRKKLDETNDRLLRLAAEYDNFRKRSQKEKEALYADCKASVIKELLPVIDNFDRVFENQDAAFEDYKKGVELTFKQFTKMLDTLGVETFGEVGEQFDPQLHDAVMHTEDDSLEENVITNVFAKGYRNGEKIIRHATVAVAN